MKHSDLNSSPRSSAWANVMVWLVPLLLIIPNICLDVTEISYNWLDRIINVALPAGIYLMLFAATRRVGLTTLLFIPMMVICAFQIVLLFLYGESIIAIDMFLNVVTTNTHEATELLRNLTGAIITVCALYLPLIIIAIVLCSKHALSSEDSCRSAVIVGAVLAVVGIGAWFCNTGYRASRLLFPVNVISNMIEATHRTALTENYFDASADYSFNAAPATADSATVVVMVIGETSRADNWELLGYDRDTNPLLSHRAGIVPFARAMSESNTTHKSVPLMMSHLDANHFGDSIYCSKGILEAFREGGYCTAWLSNQQRNGALIDFYGEQANDVRFINDDGHSHYDMDLCPHLKEIIDAHPGENVFVVLHTYGCHFNYRERYPDSFNHFRPDDSSSASRGNRQGLVNAYDNAIGYTDAMLDSIVSILNRSDRPTTMLYMADHGEDIFDDNRERFLHASPTPTYWQLHVPLVFWCNESYRSCHSAACANITANAKKNVSTSRSAFHTLIALGGINTPVYDNHADLSSRAYTEPTRIFLNDYNEAVHYSASGMRMPDFKELAAHSIDY